MEQVSHELNGQPGRRLIFLGTGAAWRTPELGCPCLACSEMRRRGEHRTRTSLYLDGPVKVLVDCGPDIVDQLEACSLGRPDLILITHEHGDHFLGLDELEAFRRHTPKDRFKPIPIYAHPEAWPAIEIRFGYLLGKLLEKRLASPQERLDGLGDTGLDITPFKTNHGPVAKGSIGYVLEFKSEGRTRKMVYTSDFEHLPEEPPILLEPDILVGQAQWFNEPNVNIPHHMSFQRLLDYIARWRPREQVFLVHLSDGDLHPGERSEDYLKKRPPLDPLSEPDTGQPFPAPRCQEEWQAAASSVFKAYGLSVPVTVAYDGLEVDLQPD